MLPNRYKETFTVTAADAAGFADDVTGATWALAATTPDDDLAHLVTILNNSATDHSAKTAVLTGTDANDFAQTETVNLPAASVSVTSTKYFKTLTGVVPSATIGADTVDIGWAAAAVTPYVRLDSVQNGFGVSVAVSFTGTLNYTVQHVFEPLAADVVAFNHTGLTGVAANDDGAYANPIYGVRVKVNSHTSGVVTFYVLQGDRS
jgi:hypothetical protein